MTFFATAGMTAEDLLPSLTLFLGGVPGRPRARGVSPGPPPAAVATAPAPAADPRVSLALAIVLFADGFKTSPTAF